MPRLATAITIPVMSTAKQEKKQKVTREKTHTVASPLTSLCMVILTLKRLAFVPVPDSRTVTNCFAPPARFRRRSRFTSRIDMNIVRYMMFLVLGVLLGLLLSTLLPSLALWLLG